MWTGKNKSFVNAEVLVQCRINLIRTTLIHKTPERNLRTNVWPNPGISIACVLAIQQRWRPVIRKEWHETAVYAVDGLMGSFQSDAMSTGRGLFSFLTCREASKFVLLCVFTLIGRFAQKFVKKVMAQERKKSTSVWRASLKNVAA